MADTSKTKVLNIETGKAQSNVKTLKQQIKELRDQMGQLEKGTVEYDAVAKQLGATLQKQKEITEATKNTSQDFGATLSNLSSVAAGVMGAFNAVNAAMVMMGADGEEAQQAMKSVQMTMAIIQGMGAMDNASHALKRIINSFSSVSSKENISNTQQLSNAEKDLQRSINGTTNTQRISTQTTDMNTTSKRSNTSATNTAAAANNAMNVSGTASIGIFTKMRLGLQSLTASLRTFALTNPFTTLLLGASAVVGIFSAISSAAKKANDDLDKQKTTVEDLVGGYLRLSQVQGNIASGIDFENDEKTIKVINDLLGQFYKFSREATRAGHDRNQNWKDFYAYIYKTGTEEQKQIVALAQAVDNLNQAHNNLERTIRQEYDTEVDRQEAINTAREAELKMEEERNAVYSQYIQNQNKDLNNTNKLKKSREDLLEIIKRLYKTTVGNLFSMDEMDAVYNGEYNKFMVMVEKMKSYIKANGIGDMLTDEYKQFLEDFDGELPDPSFRFSLDFVFDKNKMDELRGDLEKEEEQLRKYSTGEETATEEQLEAQQKIVQTLNDKVQKLGEIMSMNTELSTSYRAHTKELHEHERLMNEIDMDIDNLEEYYNDLLSNNPFIEINKTINDTRKSLTVAETKLAELKETYEELQKDPKSKEKDEERLAVEKQIAETEREIHQLNIQYLEAEHNARMKHLEEFYDEYKKEANAAKTQIDSFNLFFGQTDNYNTNLQFLQLDLDAIKNQMSEVEAMYGRQKKEIRDQYQELMEMYEEGSKEYEELVKERKQREYELEIEHNERMSELQQEQMNKSVEIEQEKSRRRLNIAKTYISLYSTISSQIGSILSAEMDRYDENTEEYKKLKYRQGVITTTEGVLSAFMSGIESGVPAPWNLVLAFAMAATTAAAGIMQLNNIKNEKVGGTMPTTTDLSSREYDTLSYQTNVDTLGAIQDQRVIVVESDITDTQRRVEVAETQAVF